MTYKLVAKEKLADYKVAEFVYHQKADTKLGETVEEEKLFSEVQELYKYLIDGQRGSTTDPTKKGAMKDANMKTENVEFSKG